VSRSGRIRRAGADGASGRVVSRAALRDHVWQGREDRGTNLVEVHPSRLRDKLGEDAAIVETVRGAGYRVRPNASSR